MRVYCFDTELTDRENGEIIEAAWERFAAPAGLLGPEFDLIPISPATGLLGVDDRFEARYRPEKPTTFGALSVHHILPNELEECPPSSSFRLPEDAQYLIGHNIDTDWTAAGKPDVKRIDTCAIARHLWSDADSHSQSALLYRLLGATPETRAALKNAHSALADVQNNIRLLEKILETKSEITTWSALWAFSEECRIPKICTFQRYKGIPLEELPLDFVGWVLRQSWIDDYTRIGYRRVWDRHSGAPDGAISNPW